MLGSPPHHQPRRRYARCRRCRYPVRWLRFGGDWRAFDPRAVHPRDRPAVDALPVRSERAWTVTSLVEDLMAADHHTRDEARRIVDDLQWLARHVCPPNPTKGP